MERRWPKANSPTCLAIGSMPSADSTLSRSPASEHSNFSARPFLAVIVMGDAMGPIPPTAKSQTRVPLREFSTGPAMTSPVGRFNHLKRFQSYFVSVKKSLPSTLNEMSVPFGLVTLTLLAP